MSANRRRLANVRVAGTAAAALAAGLSACSGIGGDAEPKPRGEIDTKTTERTTAGRVTGPRTTKPEASQTALARLVGQKFVVAYRGTIVPPPRLLQRIERGEVGGVILFTDNVPRDGATGMRRVVARLQRAARAGGNPRLLIMTDQEGGDIRRVPGPPRRSPSELGAGDLRSVMSVAVSTGRSLRRMGVGVDLAPVVDVPADASSFLNARAYSAPGRRNELASVVFAEGLQQAGIAATAKHYPGLGSSGARDTDRVEVTLDTPLAVMERERSAFVRHVRRGTRLVMVSSATYAAYDRTRPAVVSRRIIGRLRRDGFRGVVISDELRVPGLRRFGAGAASAATRAGVDVLLFANSSGDPEYRMLLADVRAGRVRPRLVERQVTRIIALKRWIAAGGGA